MLTPEQESAVLEEARRRLWIRDSDIPLADAATAGEQGATHYSSRIDRLIAAGHLTDEQVQQLLSELWRTVHAETVDGRHLRRESSSSGQVSVPLDVPEWLHSWERYEILSLIGQGGMGSVYRARDRRLGRLVALKFIRAPDAQLAQRFLQEARAQARIAHENICKVLEVGELAGQQYIAMEFIAGETLLTAQRRMSLAEKVQLAKEVAEALHAAHSQGIIHRDIKPANILVEVRPDGRYRPVVTDFGLARDANSGQNLTETGAVMGTPAYMSPEQAAGDTRSIDARTDIYSLGALMYELFSSEPPFAGGNTVAVLLRVVHDDPVPLRKRNSAVPRDLETIVSKCLNKEPRRRYDSAAFLAADLHRFLDGEPILAQQPTWSYRAIKKARKHRGLVALSGLLVLCVALLVAVIVRARVRAAAERQRAEAQARLAQRLGQDVKEIELFMRVAYAMPLHDINQERAWVRKRMAGLQALLKDQPEVLRGPVHYALGRGHLVLQELWPARQELEAALHSGYDQPAVHYALAQVLIELAEEERYKRPSAAGGNVKQRWQEIQAQLLAPAQQHLSRCTNLELESKTLLKAMLSAAAEDFPGALELALRAAAEAPWLAEARLVAARALFAQLARMPNEAPDWQSLVDRSARQWAEAVDASRSDPLVLRQCGKFWSMIMVQNFRTYRPLEAAARASIAANHQALRADPGLLDAHGDIGFAHSYLARWRVREGLDPVPDTLAGFAALTEASKRQPDNWFFHFVANNLLLIKADYLRSTGRDPLPDLVQATAAAQRAIELNSQKQHVYNDLLAAYVIMLEYQISHGQDTTATLDAAQRVLAALASHFPDSTMLLDNQSNLALLRGTIARRRGEDPRPQLERAAQYKYKPNAVDAWPDVSLGSVALARYGQAEHTPGSGLDSPPLRALADAIAEHARVVPKSDLLRRERALYAQLRARARFAANQPPSVEVADGLAALQPLRQAQPMDAELLLLHASLLQWRALGETRPAALQTLLEAWALLFPGPPGGDGLVDMHLARARLLRLQATLLPGPDSDRRLAEAEAAVARARTLEPSYVDVQAEAAAIDILRSRRNGAVNFDAALNRLRAAAAKVPGLAALYRTFLSASYH